jgi:alpha-glucoside transport system permease protein
MDRIGLLLLAVVGVPLVLTGFIVLVESGLRLLPARAARGLRPFLWIAPVVALVTLFLVYPSIRTLLYSVSDSHGESFVGLANYEWLAGSDAFWTAVRNNVLWVVLFTGLVLAFGLILAVLTDRVRYEPIPKSLIFLPMAISFVAAGVIWKFVLDYRPPGTPQAGLLNAIATSLGGQPRPWLIEPPENNVFLIIVGVWVWTGFAMVIISAALKAVPREIIEAARVDGAGEIRVFFSILMPLLGPTVAVVATTLVIFALKAFDVVYVMTAGNYDTQVLAYLMYQQLFSAGNLGRASAIAVILLAAVIPVLIINVRRSNEEWVR